MIMGWPFPITLTSKAFGVAVDNAAIKKNVRERINVFMIKNLMISLSIQP
jgi:hypothetical protein